MQTDGTLPTGQRSLFATEETENKPKKQSNSNRHKSQINNITSRLEALTLSMNVMKNTVNQQSKISIMHQPADSNAPAPGPNLRPPCFGCGIAGHSSMNCSEITLLCQKSIVHQDENGKICWGKEGSEEM